MKMLLAYGYIVMQITTDSWHPKIEFLQSDTHIFSQRKAGFISDGVTGGEGGG